MFMQKIQEEVKKDMIRHPTGIIEVVYEPGKTTLTAADEELLAAFIKLKDFEQQMKETADNLYHECQPVKETIDELREELKGVKTSFDACSGLADKLSEPSYVFEETSLDKVTSARDKTEELLRINNLKLEELYQKVSVIQDKINEYNAANENRLDTLFEEYNKLSMEHLENPENNSIDAAHFDQQFDEFRSFRSELDSRRTILIEDCQQVVNEYATLNLETSVVYNTWNEFMKRFDLLHALSDLHNKATGFTAN